MSPDLFHAIMDRAQVEKRFPSVMLSLSAHDCHEIREVIADRDRLRSELDAKCAELARVRASASAVFSYLDDRASFGSGNAPGHAHTRPGIWDDDNGTKAGSECEWCKTWNAFRAELARMEAQ